MARLRFGPRILRKSSTRSTVHQAHRPDRQTTDSRWNCDYTSRHRRRLRVGDWGSGPTLKNSWGSAPKSLVAPHHKSFGQSPNCQMANERNSKCTRNYIWLCPNLLGEFTVLLKPLAGFKGGPREGEGRGKKRMGKKKGWERKQGGKEGTSM